MIVFVCTVFMSPVPVLFLISFYVSCSRAMSFSHSRGVSWEFLDGLSTRCLCVGFFGAGAGTGRFIMKLLGADARTHPGFSEREV